MSYDLLITGGRVVLEGLGPVECDLGITDGRFAAILASGSSASASETIDARGLVVLPGVVDPHVHFGLGSPDDWATESVAAALGGVTTVLNYVQGSRSFTEVVPEERARAERDSVIDFGIHCIVMNETHLAEIGALVDEHGIWSFKYFANFKGDEGAYMGVEGTDTGFMYALFRAVAAHPEAILAVHPENIETIWRIAPEIRASGREDLGAWTDSRPDFVEAHDMFTAFLFAEQTGCRLYIPHLTAERGLGVYREHRARGGTAVVETCAHYLTHTRWSGIGNLGKVNPPLREPSDVAALWDGLDRGEISVVASDHNSRPRAKKEGSIWTAGAAFPGVTTLLPIMLSEGYHRRGMSLDRIASLLSRQAARTFRLSPDKGTIEVGAHADLALVDLAREVVVDGSAYGSHSDFSIYDGWTLRGWPVMTIVRGTVVMREGEVIAPAGTGTMVARHPAAASTLVEAEGVR
jgi:dihydropyrimidinase